MPHINKQGPNTIKINIQPRKRMNYYNQERRCFNSFKNTSTMVGYFTTAGITPKSNLNKKKTNKLIIVEAWSFKFPTERKVWLLCKGWARAIQKAGFQIHFHCHHMFTAGTDKSPEKLTNLIQLDEKPHFKQYNMKKKMQRQCNMIKRYIDISCFIH